MTSSGPKDHPPVVMFVDDHQDTRDGYAIFLEWAGVFPSPVPSAEAAFTKLEAVKPDLIVCDVRLPGMTGIEFLHSLQARPATAGIPVILLTGDSHFERTPPSAALLLRKPVTPDDLLAKILGLLPPTR